MKSQLLRYLFALVASAALVTAQGTLTVNPATLTPGQKADVNYSNPARAGQDILVLVDDGAFPIPTILEIPIHLDADGNGSAKWVVPNWFTAFFTGPDGEEVFRFIGGGGDISDSSSQDLAQSLDVVPLHVRN